MGTARTIKIGILTAPHIDYEIRKDTFLLRAVRIGIGFHWDRYEDQEFAGSLTIRDNADGTQTAINTIDLESYIASVISSEMNANSPMELLKAHAVISRSWAIRAMAKPSHEGFDVCADDHCQRYEGLRRMNERALQAVRETAGEVLMVRGEQICDCRYHKCCGGRTEIWRTCWEDIDVPYIRSVRCDWCDIKTSKTPPAPLKGSENKVNVRERILGLILNDYDQETTDFRDWSVTYTEEELDAIIAEKSGIDFGHITAITPLHRGPSGRIDSLRITGTKHTDIIGKELKIRLWLSRKCLYSSWFDIEHSAANRQWTLTGHGWGHGAGLCQIGAAVMASEGKTYTQILSYYYAGTRISTAAR